MKRLMVLFFGFLLFDGCLVNKNIPTFLQYDEPIGFNETRFSLCVAEPLFNIQIPHANKQLIVGAEDNSNMSDVKKLLESQNFSIKHESNISRFYIVEVEEDKLIEEGCKLEQFKLVSGARINRLTHTA